MHGAERVDTGRRALLQVAPRNMSDVQVLFLVLGAFYAWECACWLPRGSVVFTTWLGRVWRRRDPATWLGNSRGGFVFAPPLPPLGTLVQSSPFPFSLSPEAALAFVPTTVPPACRPRQPGWFLPWQQFREARAAERKLRVNGRLWWTAPSASLAKLRADELARLARLPDAERAPALRALFEASLDTTAVQSRLAAFDRASRPLRPWCSALVVFTFALAPAAIWCVGLRLSWAPLVAALLAQIGVIATRFARAHRALFPEATEERFAKVLTVALSPANAMRALDALSRPLFEAFHPLAVAAVLLPPADFRDLARAVLLDVRHPAQPVCPEPDPAAQATEQYARRLLEEAVERVVRRRGLDPDALRRPPQPVEPDCRAYCPRCGAQFTTTHGTCADCGGLALVAFEPAASARADA